MQNYNLKFKIILFLAFFFLFNFPCFASEVVINEILPNPSGDENQDEWVELYNSGSEKDISGWALYDASDHELVIEASKTNTGNTIINSNSWLVIYRRGASFSLNNSGEEIVKLYNNQISTFSAELIDTIVYNDSSEEKTWGKVPDGSSNWTDGLNKTPGSANQGLASPSPSASSSPSLSPETDDSDNSAEDSVLPSPSLAPATINVKKASPKPSPSPSSKEEEEEEQVLGEDTSHREEQGEQEKEEEKEKKPFKLSLPLVISGIGLVLLLGASFPFLKPYLVKWMDKIKSKKKHRLESNVKSIILI